MSLQLRDYQVIMYEQAKELRRNGATSMIFQAPTGSGKTVMAATVLQTCADKGFYAWFIVHRREILRQSLLKLTEAGVPAGIIKAGMPETKHAKIQVCSIQTLARRHYNLVRPNLIVYDECHHIASNTWSAIHAAYPDAVHLGLTATPQRLDGAGLGRYFEHLLLGPSTRELIDQGWLSPYRLFAPGARPDMSGIHTVAGDYNKKELADLMRQSAVSGDAVAHYLKHVPGKRAIVFMWSVESSVEIVERFNQAGVAAAHIDGDTDEKVRDRIIERFASGQILVLSNVDIVSEGFDLPACDAGFFCRPTQSLTLWLQQLGRCLRPAPNKVAYLFDHASNSRRLGLPDDDHEWSLDGLKKKKGESVNRKDAVRVCPQCNEAWPMTVRTCRCGYVLINAREMEVDGEAQLAEISEHELALRRRAQLSSQARAKRLQSLIIFGRKKGYKNPEFWAEKVLQGQEDKRYRELKIKEPPPVPMPAPIQTPEDNTWVF